MRSNAYVASVLLVTAACGPDAPAEPAGEAACPITAPTRLVAAPADFEPVEDVWYGLHVFGDDILYTFDRYDDPDREYWRLNRCTGDVEPYAPLAPGLHNPYPLETPNGRVLYGNDADGRPFVLDRFDVAGDDEPRPVLGLPDRPGFVTLPRPGMRYNKFFDFWTSQSEEPIFNAAGLGAYTFGLYVHHGEPDVPAVRLSETILAHFEVDATQLLIHEDSGEVHRVDAMTGERELLMAGVRYAAYGYDGRTLVWQAIGDDIAEPVYLRDLDTGSDVQIAVNNFAALSWNRGAERDTGQWYYTDDHAAVALFGPDGWFVAAARVDTGEALAVPEHIGQRGSVAGYFAISLADPVDEVWAIWDPLAGEVREWYRGPLAKPMLLGVDGDVVEYYVEAADDFLNGTIWRADLRTGETAERFAGIGLFPLQLDDSRYLVHVSRGALEGPPGDGHSFLSPVARDWSIVDLATGASTSIATNIASAHGFADEGMVYLDAHGPDPGVWAYPYARQ
ncbi:hypothetical protein [Nannocystis radixulma]|uniref:Lipoprotein n=1 Tax=Nannocystis radixulma TaxID=2995305 RepID=A0ABT5BNG4_9BACT|nr:hypothetical protein [Nannocystis radixulma]MDC0675716.1 hypothetical protein [Nannocystis radixulma]